MNKISIQYKGKTKDGEMPSCWQELNREQFLAAVKIMPLCEMKKTYKDDESLRVLCGIDKETWSKTDRDIKIELSKYFDWIAQEIPEFQDAKMEWVEIEGVEYQGMKRSFANITWIEFVWADTLYLHERYDEMTAVLYRRADRNRPGIDKRDPFDESEIGERAKLIRKLDDNTRIAIVIAYAAMKRSCLEKKYRYVFPEREEKKEEAVKEKAKKNAEKFSWTEVHYNLMGERFYEAEKYEKTRLSIVLNHLNESIWNSMKNGKK